MIEVAPPLDANKAAHPASLVNTISTLSSFFPASSVLGVSFDSILQQPF